MAGSKKLIAVGVALILVLGIASFALYKSGYFKSDGKGWLNPVSGKLEEEASGSIVAAVIPTPTPTPLNKYKGVDVRAKALYLTGWTVGNLNNVNHYVKLAKDTEINAYVVDIKDDDGFVGYESSVDEVKKLKAWRPKYQVEPVIKAFHENDIYVIGRVVCFKDPVAAGKHPEWAIQSKNGGVWRDKDGRAWLDPYNKDAWPYLINIAKEGISKGFDEIQFDYIRFANDGSKHLMNFSKYAPKQRHEAINEFIAYAKKEIPDIRLSADVFGIICESPADTEQIGQYLELVGKELDYISPMAYPSHYAVGQVVNGVKFMKPDLEPYGVVYNTLAKAKSRIAAVQAGGYKARVRPYIQDFTASWLGKGYYQVYGQQQLRDQIKAVYDAGYEEWIVWNAANKYSEGALQKQ